jgi:hypothetical protein
MKNLNDSDLRRIEKIQAASAVVFCFGFISLVAVTLFGRDALVILLGN